MIPFSFLLIPYGLAVAAVLAYGALTMLSLFRFGGDAGAFFATLLFWAGVACILFFTWTALLGVDWTQPLVTASTFLPTTF